MGVLIGVFIVGVVVGGVGINGNVFGVIGVFVVGWCVLVGFGVGDGC